MKRIKAKSARAQEADALVSHLQKYFADALGMLSSELGENKAFVPIEWFREEGKSGGGVRYVARDDKLFDRASVNVSQVQYESDESRALSSATALSTIIHPRNPHAPSIHMHISWTEMKEGRGYWRMMADLNPSIFYAKDKALFEKRLQLLAPEVYEEASAQGDKYFYIPALGRNRGVSHFYLENFTAKDDVQMAKRLIEGVIDTYIEIISKRMTQAVSEEERAEQLAYHTLYLFQVLSLDRGTTSGLLVHDENDVGIMGSVPSHINTALLHAWKETVGAPQDLLIDAILGCLDSSGAVDDAQKVCLAKVTREHYKKHPKALELQASGYVSVPTVQNHR
ncbi:MAG: coproporphyrinogen III oxidase [Campylobacterales bacterium]|nr:coproporphyrinogen III oxidase [Campylobacterales bacterium]